MGDKKIKLPWSACTWARTSWHSLRYHKSNRNQWTSPLQNGCGTWIRRWNLGPSPRTTSQVSPSALPSLWKKTETHFNQHFFAPFFQLYFSHLSNEFNFTTLHKHKIHKRNRSSSNKQNQIPTEKTRDLKFHHFLLASAIISNKQNQIPIERTRKLEERNQTFETLGRPGCRTSMTCINTKPHSKIRQTGKKKNTHLRNFLTRFPAFSSWPNRESTH